MTYILFWPSETTTRVKSLPTAARLETNICLGVGWEPTPRFAAGFPTASWSLCESAVPSFSWYRLLYQLKKRLNALNSNTLAAILGGDLTEPPWFNQATARSREVAGSREVSATVSAARGPVPSPTLREENECACAWTLGGRVYDRTMPEVRCSRHNRASL